MSKKRKDPDSSCRRFHVVVPAADEQVVTWLNAQANISLSIRILIKAYIAKYGFVDPMCLSPADFSSIFTGQTGNAEITISETTNTSDIASSEATDAIELMSQTAQPISASADPAVQTASMSVESTINAPRGTVFDNISAVSTNNSMDHTEDSISKSNTMIEDMLNL